MAKYWFRRRKGLLSKDVGFGWIPISTEGWIITLGLIIVSFWLSKITSDKGDLILPLISIIIVFAFIADKKTQNPVVFK